MDEGVKEKDWMLYSTDKSGRLVLDKKDNFLREQQKHANRDKVATLGDVRESEIVLYQHSRALVKIFNVGRDAGENQQDRISESMKVVTGGVPAMTGLRKDHKVG